MFCCLFDLRFCVVFPRGFPIHVKLMVREVIEDRDRVKSWMEAVSTSCDNTAFGRPFGHLAESYPCGR